MIAVRPRPVITAVAALLVLATFFLLHPNRTGTSLSFARGSKVPVRPSSSSSKSDEAELPYGRLYRGHSEPDDINRVTNGTLGFGKVFVVGLPERTDKRDAMVLASSLTGFDVEWVDGVRGESIPDKAVPFGVNRVKLMEGNLGSWRGHMNAIRRYCALEHLISLFQRKKKMMCTDMLAPPRPTGSLNTISIPP